MFHYEDKNKKGMTIWVVGSEGASEVRILKGNCYYIRLLYMHGPHCLQNLLEHLVCLLDSHLCLSGMVLSIFGALEPG